jgi:uncharacterized protein (DUF433 family)
MFADLAVDNFDAGLSAAEIAETYELRLEQVQAVIDYAIKFRADQQQS